jgi:hypothetical protein
VANLSRCAWLCRVPSVGEVHGVARPLLNNRLLALNGNGNGPACDVDRPAVRVECEEIKLRQVFVCQCGSEWMRRGEVGKGRNGKFDRICCQDRRRCHRMQYLACKGAAWSLEWGAT